MKKRANPSLRLPSRRGRRPRQEPRSSQTTTVIDNSGLGAPFFPLYVRDLNPHPAKWPGMEFRSSTRWFSETSSKREVFQVPFVSKSGKFSASTLYFWRAYPEQVFMSVLSTVYQRILKIMLKRFSHVNRRYRDACIKVSAVYMILKNDYIIDRFLGMARPGTPIKVVSNFAHYCAIQLDEDERFVYSQALHRANWLKFQAHGPGDKSSKHRCHRTHLRNLLDGLDEPNLIGKYEGFKKSVDFWKSKYFGTLRSSSFEVDFDEPSDYDDILAHSPMEGSGWMSELSENHMQFDGFLRDELW